MLAVALAVVAVATNEPEVVDVLVVPPLVAAAAGSARRTGFVALVSIGLAAFVAALRGGEMDSDQYVFPVLTVILSGGVSVALARLRTQREADSSRLAIQYEVARALSEADTLEEAAPRVLEAIGRPFGWALGGLWEVRPPRVLRCVRSWYAPDVDPAGFEKLSRQFVLRPGIGLPGRVWESGEPAYVLEVGGDQDFQRAALAAQAGLHGTVAFPIRRRGETVGVIEFFARSVREPDADLLEMMAALGSQIGEFIEGFHAGEALKASEARKGAMLESALDAVVTMDHEGHIVEFNPAAERIFGRTEEQVVGRLLADTIIPPELRERHRLGLQRYLETGRATVLGHRMEVSALRADGTQFPAELAISRISGHEPAMFTGYIRDITDRLQGEAERERLLELESLTRMDATRARDQLEAILRGVADGVTAQSPTGALVFANDAAVSQMGFASVEELLSAAPEELLSGFELLDEDGEAFPPERLPGRRALAGEAATEVVRFRVRDTGEEQWSVVKSTPIRDEHGNVTLAINVIEDVTESKRSEQAQAFLAEASAILARSLDFDATVQQVAELAVPAIADYCVVDVVGAGGRLERAALAHAAPEQVALVEELTAYDQPDEIDAGGPRVVRTGVAELLPEIPSALLEQAAQDERHLELMRELDMRSAIAAPMVARGRTVGTVSFVVTGNRRRYGAADLALAEELGRRTGIAVDNARLYRERSHIAKTLQASLLPSALPDLPGFTTAARFRPTGEGTDVGGDFYDLFQSADDRWTVAIGDVCGKGPDAAAVTALARYTLRAAAMREDTPSHTLGTLNEAMLRQRADMRFCTVAYGVLDRSIGNGARLRLGRAGHPPPLLLRADGRVEELGSAGTLLGVVADPELSDDAADIHPGDTVVFYTDGVTEAHGPYGNFGPPELARLLADSAGMSADEIAGRVEQAAVSTGTGEPRDDIAVVVVQACRP